MPNMIYTRNPATHRLAVQAGHLPAAAVETFCLCSARVMLRRGRYVEHTNGFGRCEYSGKTPAQARQMAREETQNAP